jgi:formylglycine-generating enzyme required for sulfatase activity
MKLFLLIFLSVFIWKHNAFSQQSDSKKRPASYTNGLGMEFEMIRPGSMIAGRLELQCPTPPDTRDVDESEKWTAEDFERCEELARRDSRAGFTVAIEKTYYMGRYEVTQGQWKKVMGYNPSFFQGERAEGDENHYPVENVSWEEAQEFIRRLNALDSAVVYRLPTEFEWEYAARAGAAEPLSWAETRKQAWIQYTDKGSTQAVGQMEPNTWCLYDMLGNVWEWVEDFHNEDILPGPVPPSSGEVHVLKGGSFTSDVVNATYFFHGGGPGNGYDVGFRVVMEVKE